MDESEVLMQKWTTKMSKVRLTKGDPPMASIYDFIAIAQEVKCGRNVWNRLIKKRPEVRLIVKQHYTFSGNNSSPATDECGLIMLLDYIGVKISVLKIKVQIRRAIQQLLSKSINDIFVLETKRDLGCVQILSLSTINSLVLQEKIIQEATIREIKATQTIGYIYVVTNPSFQRDCIYKIGRTVNLDERMSSYTTSYGEVIIVYIQIVTQVNKLPEIESTILKRCKIDFQHYIGELFIINNVFSLINLIHECCTAKFSV